MAPIALRDGPRGMRTRKPRRWGETHAREELAPDRRGVAPCIVVAEDDAQMRRVLAGCLWADGYEVIEAQNGAQVIESLGSLSRRERVSDVELIICDIRMPRMTGLAMLVELRRYDRKTPVILITAFGDAGTHANAYRLGATAVLDKPFDLTELRWLVHRVVPPPRSTPMGGVAVDFL